MKTPGISLSNVSLSFENRCLFDDLDFNLAMGDKVTIVGENGCGKTTFLRLLSGVDYLYSGSIQIEGRIGFLPQHFEEISGDEPAILTLLRSLQDPEMDDFLQEEQHPFEILSSTKALKCSPK